MSQNEDADRQIEIVFEILLRLRDGIDPRLSDTVIEHLARDIVVALRVRDELK